MCYLVLANTLHVQLHAQVNSSCDYLIAVPTSINEEDDSNSWSTAIATDICLSQFNTNLTVYSLVFSCYGSKSIQLYRYASIDCTGVNPLSQTVLDIGDTFMYMNTSYQLSEVYCDSDSTSMSSSDSNIDCAISYNTYYEPYGRQAVQTIKIDIY